MNSVTAATGWEKAAQGTPTGGRRGTKAGEDGGRRPLDPIRIAGIWFAAAVIGAVLYVFAVAVMSL